MTALYIIAFLIACIGIVLALGITPERVGEDMKRFFDKQQTMQDMAKEAQGKKKPNKLMVEMIRIRKVLEETNKENQFSIALALSLVLMVFGCILGIVIDNIFLAPILAEAFALIPFMYLKGTINMYKKQVDQTLESSLNAVTNTYLECNNIRTAVEQCLPAFRQPIYGVFDEFLGKIEDVSPDVVGAIAQMKNQIDKDEPRLFVAKALTKACAVGILAIPAFFIFKILGLAVLAFAVFVYFNETKGITRKIKKKRAKIEAELPRFVSFVNNKLSHTRDLISILRSYKETAGAEFKEELETTIVHLEHNRTEALTNL